MSTNVKNMKSLIDALTETFNGLLAGQISTEQAREISRMSGKIISGAKCQLEYNKHMKQSDKIPFLEQAS